jgi:hypothetical protein
MVMIFFFKGIGGGRGGETLPLKWKERGNE